MQVSKDAIHSYSDRNWAVGLKEYTSSIATRIPRNIREIFFSLLEILLVLILLMYSYLGQICQEE